MQDFLFDNVNIVPEAKRRSRSRSGGGFLGRVIGGIFSSIGLIFILIIAVLLLPFILIRNRRNPSNDFLINQNDFNNNNNQNGNIQNNNNNNNDIVNLKK